MNKRREELDYFLNILENLEDFNNDLSEKNRTKNISLINDLHLNKINSILNEIKEEKKYEDIPCLEYDRAEYGHKLFYIKEKFLNNKYNIFVLDLQINILSKGIIVNKDFFDYYLKECNMVSTNYFLKKCINNSNFTLIKKWTNFCLN